MNSPLVTVVIPLYNKADVFEATLSSVLAQTYSDFLVVVVDDGSTDNSAKVLNRFSDPRISLVSKENGGISSARNAGIQSTVSEFVGFIDADDHWHPDFLKEMVNFAQLNPEAGLYCSDYMICKVPGTFHRRRAYSSRVPSGIYDYFSLSKNTLSASSVVVRRAVFDFVGLFDVTERVSEDLDMWFRIGLYYKIGYVNRKLAVWNMIAPNRSDVRKLGFDVQRFSLEGRYFSAMDDPSISDDRKKIISEYYKRQIFDYSLTIYSRGGKIPAMHLLKRNRIVLGRFGLLFLICAVPAMNFLSYLRSALILGCLKLVSRRRNGVI